jgi:hypothetical protein
LQSPPLSAHWARLQTAGVEVIGESTAEVSRTASGSSFFAEGPYRSYAVIDARRGGIRRALGARARLGWAHTRRTGRAALDDRLGRAAGELLAATRRRDVLDAAIVLLAHDAIRLSPPILASNRWRAPPVDTSRSSRSSVDCGSWVVPSGDVHAFPRSG